MAGCRIVNQSMLTAVENINTISGEYTDAADTLITSLNSAIADMEGAAKDALQEFIDTDVTSFVKESIPSAVKGLADLLEANRSNFESTDKSLADNISGGEQ